MENSVLDSLLFLSYARNTICETIDDSKVQYFIQNEATDFQIIELLVTGETTTYRVENHEKEVELWKLFKEQLHSDKDNIIEMFDEALYDEMLYELGPVFMYGFSSQKPILEFHLEQELISEETPADRVKRMKAYAKRRGMQAYKGMERVGTATKKAGRTVAKTAKSIDKVVQDPGAAAKKARAKGQEVAKVATAKGEELAKKGSALAKKHDKAITGGLATAALATAAAYAASKIYKNFLSKAARDCKGAADKEACMTQAKQKATQAKISKLQSSMSNCRDEKCKASLATKIEKERAKGA